MSLAHKLESKSRTPKQIQDLLLDTKQFPLSDDWAKTKWLRLEEAIKAIADKNLERFAEIKALEDKIEEYRKYIYIAPDYKHPDKEFLLLMNSVNSKFEKLFGEPSDTFKDRMNANLSTSKEVEKK